MDFPYSKKKGRNAYLWFRHHRKGEDSLYVLKALKLVLFADLNHFKQFGFPMVGGQLIFPNRNSNIKGLILHDLDLDKDLINIQDKNYDENELSEVELAILSNINDCYGSWELDKLVKLSISLCPNRNGFISWDDITMSWNNFTSKQAAMQKAINDHICIYCKNDRCSKTEKSCWKCGNPI